MLVKRQYLGKNSGSIHRTFQSDPGSQEGVGNLHNTQIDNTGYETMGSVSHEAIALHAFADVHQPPNTDSDVVIDTDVISEECRQCSGRCVVIL